MGYFPNVVIDACDACTESDMIQVTYLRIPPLAGCLLYIITFFYGFSAVRCSSGPCGFLDVHSLFDGQSCTLSTVPHLLIASSVPIISSTDLHLPVVSYQ